MLALLRDLHLQVLQELISVLKLEGKLDECAHVHEELLQHFQKCYGPNSARTLKHQVRSSHSRGMSMQLPQIVTDQAWNHFSALWPPGRRGDHLASNAVYLAAGFRVRRRRDFGLSFQLGVFTESTGAIGRGRTYAV